VKGKATASSIELQISLRKATSQLIEVLKLCADVQSSKMADAGGKDWLKRAYRHAHKGFLGLVDVDHFGGSEGYQLELKSRENFASGLEGKPGTFKRDHSPGVTRPERKQPPPDASWIRPANHNVRLFKGQES
jgi:hypothetical protein